MSGTSNPHFTPISQPVDAIVAGILGSIDAVARSLDLEYLLVGATARDLMFVNVFNLTGWRATRDIDFGVAIEDWRQFELLKRAVLDTGRFQECAGRTHRMLYEPAAGFATPVDFIPFGGVTMPDGTIAWPPDRDFIMNVAGFAEALDSALHVRIDSDLSIRVASIPALAVLKLLAWRDRRYENNKDATDLARMLGRYAEAGNLDRLYGESLPVLEAAGFDIEIAGAVLLGRDASVICNPSTFAQARAVLDSERLTDALTAQMLQLALDTELEASRITNLVNAFREGFRERHP